MEKVKFNKTKAHQRYKTTDGTPVPGVTTILNLQAKPALLNWAWECGMKGEDYRKVKDTAASIGSIAHWLIELHLTRKTPDTSEFSPADMSKAENAMIKFLSWWDSSGFVFAKSEEQLVSDTLRYGGTLDIVALDPDGKVCLIDLKTSKGIYSEYWQQVAAYAALWNECNSARVQRFFICRFGKEESEADFEVQERSDLAKEFAVFRAFLGAYYALKALK